jgi:hypothetical protein
MLCRFLIYFQKLFGCEYCENIGAVDAGEIDDTDLGKIDFTIFLNLSLAFTRTRSDLLERCVVSGSSVTP